jgi:hypothetical protein
MSADDTIAAAEKGLRHVRLAAHTELKERSVEHTGLAGSPEGRGVIIGYLPGKLEKRHYSRRVAVFWPTGKDFRNGPVQMNGNRVQLLREAVLCCLLVAGAAGLAQAQDGHIAPAPSQVTPPAIPMWPQAPAQIPVLKPSDVSVPKCRDAKRVECRSTRQNSGRRRLNRAN